MVRIEPDKHRFIDADAFTSRCLVHSVEVSDARSLLPFLTFWVKGKELGQAWALATGLSDHHDREIYHRETEPWIPIAFPGMESKGWSKHYHLNLKAAPRWEDFRPFLDQMPKVLQDELLAYFTAVNQ